MTTAITIFHRVPMGTLDSVDTTALSDVHPASWDTATVSTLGNLQEEKEKTMVNLSKLESLWKFNVVTTDPCSKWTRWDLTKSTKATDV